METMKINRAALIREIDCIVYLALDEQEMRGNAMTEEEKCHYAREKAENVLNLRVVQV